MERAHITAAMELLLWAVVMWAIVTLPHRSSRAQAYWYLARGSQECAKWFGVLAIEAELRYYQEVSI